MVEYRYRILQQSSQMSIATVTNYFVNLFVPVCSPSVATTAPYNPDFMLNCITFLPLVALILAFAIFNFACEACESVTEHPAAAGCTKMPLTQSSKRPSDSNDAILHLSKILRLKLCTRTRSVRRKLNSDLSGDQFIVLNINFTAAQSSESPEYAIENSELALVIYEQYNRISRVNEPARNQLIVYECPHTKTHDYMRYWKYQRMKKLFNGFEHLKSRRYYTNERIKMNSIKRTEHETALVNECDEEIILMRIIDTIEESKKPRKPIRSQFTLNIKNLNNKH